MTGYVTPMQKIALGNSWEQQLARGAYRFGPANHSASLPSINRRDGGREGGFEAEVDVGGSV